ncbi:phosphatase PAP2 family protein [Streptomyces sp. TRM76130]|nr:phosphatase PAP2 family protein [Streptomyces sp. TRM76130]
MPPLPALRSGRRPVGRRSLTPNWWKVSVHTAVASGVAVVITVAYGWWAALLFLGVATVGWSRVSLRDHTTAQVIVGAIVGGTAAAVVFAGLR